MRLLDIQNLHTTFDIHVGHVQAVRGVTLHVDAVSYTHLVPPFWYPGGTRP